MTKQILGREVIAETAEGYVLSGTEQRVYQLKADGTLTWISNPVAGTRVQTALYVLKADLPQPKAKPGQVYRQDSANSAVYWFGLADGRLGTIAGRNYRSRAFDPALFTEVAG